LTNTGEILSSGDQLAADVKPTLSISAIVPTYNRVAYLSRALDSIIEQSVQPAEIIVVDDGSTDGTADFLRNRYGDRVTVIQQANQGVSAARRTGIEAASGDWIAFLDSDDEWLAGHLETLADVAGTVDNSVCLIFGDTVIVRDTGDQATLFQREGFSASGLAHVLGDAVATQFPYMFTLLQSSLIRREDLLATGAFLERLRTSEDFLACFRLALRSSFAVVPHPVTRLYRTRDLDESSLDKGKGLDEDYHRARMIAFGEAGASADSRAWRTPYLHAATSLTRLRLEQGSNAVPAALQQFRFGITPRAVFWTVWAYARSLFTRRNPRPC
jgi:glycosyltransferase involved in cell wall biosynthesis